MDGIESEGNKTTTKNKSEIMQSKNRGRDNKVKNEFRIQTNWLRTTTKYSITLTEQEVVKFAHHPIDG